MNRLTLTSIIILCLCGCKDKTQPSMNSTNNVSSDGWNCVYPSERGDGIGGCDFVLESPMDENGKSVLKDGQQFYQVNDSIVNKSFPTFNRFLHDIRLTYAINDTTLDVVKSNQFIRQYIGYTDKGKHYVYVNLSHYLLYKNRGDGLLMTNSHKIITDKAKGHAGYVIIDMDENRIIDSHFSPTDKYANQKQSIRESDTMSIQAFIWNAPGNRIQEYILNNPMHEDGTSLLYAGGERILLSKEIVTQLRPIVIRHIQDNSIIAPQSFFYQYWGYKENGHRIAYVNLASSRKVHKNYHREYKSNNSEEETPLFATSGFVKIDIDGKRVIDSDIPQPSKSNLNHTSFEAIDWYGDDLDIIMDEPKRIDGSDFLERNKHFFKITLSEKNRAKEIIADILTSEREFYHKAYFMQFIGFKKNHCKYAYINLMSCLPFVHDKNDLCWYVNNPEHIVNKKATEGYRGFILVNLDKNEVERNEIKNQEK